MSEKILVPDIGDYANVEIIDINVKTGDSVEVDSELLTLETEKAAMEIPSPKAGVISQMLVKVGDKVSCGDEILELEVAGATQDAKSGQEKVASASTNAKIQDVVLPDLGVDGSVAVIEISVNVGDNVEENNTLMTLESDKASMDIPAPFSGKVNAISIKVGDKVKTGDMVAKIATTENEQSTKEPTPPAPPEVSSEQPAPAPAPSPATSNEIYASPAVRRIAHELKIDLSKIKGTGRKGRITAIDLKNTIEASGSGSNGGGLAVAAKPKVDFSKFGDVEEQELSRIKKISGKALHRNWVTIPHVTQFDEADITQMEDFRQSQKEYAAQKGIRLTPIVFLLKGVVAALKEFPIFNSSLSEDESSLFMKEYYHIGVAVDTPNGLVVPVINDVDKKGLFDLALELANLSVKARDGKLSAKEMSGGCFTISSLGGIGGTYFTPIINAPEVAILGVSRSAHKQVYNKAIGEFETKLMLPLSLSYDHRVIDGADAARFITFLSNQISDIRKLLL